MNRRHKSKGQRGPSIARPTAGDRVLLYGIHAVEAALRNPLRIPHRLVLTENARHRLEAALNDRGALATAALPRDLDQALGADVVHQGALLEASALPNRSLADLDLSATAQLSPLLIVLDQVTDPHNVGAILRSAAAFGVAGLVMTERGSPPLSGALAKVASGGLEHVPVVLVTNLARSLEELAEAGCFRIGLDSEASVALQEAKAPRGATALILGAEDTGLRRLTRENCDLVCRLATPGPLASLNVSNAAAIALAITRLGQK